MMVVEWVGKMVEMLAVWLAEKRVVKKAVV